MNISRYLSPLLALAISVAGCTTVETQKIVLAEPMSEDLEARVLRETGLSGAAIGGLGGALAGFGSGFLIATVAGASPTEAALIGTAGAVAGGVAGGVGGYYQGKKQGQKIVASAMTRDNLQKLLDGAKAYNARLSKVNAQLQEELSELKAKAPSPQRAKTNSQVSRLAVKEINEANKRISQREKALNNPSWDNSQKQQYQQELNRLIGERETLVRIKEASARLSSQ
jgi:hypothetical protein